ncbi:MAG: prenyltransferase [Deltaproteobacteria bacterium]|nr:prenyltransferase [Deltaproteobacteria bacterium]
MDERSAASNQKKGFALMAEAARAPFLTASALSALVALAWTWLRHPALLDWGCAAAALTGVLFLHLAGNTINDYYDWDSSDADNEHAGPFSGGSRHRVESALSKKTFLWLTVLFLLVAGTAGAYLVLRGRIHVLTLGAIGALGGILYSARPFELMSHGLGELDILAMFGPLTTFGMGYAIEGRFGGEYLAVGLPVGILVTAIIWINEFPDVDADERAGKRNLVVRLGRRQARWGLVALMAAYVTTLPILYLAGIFPLTVLLALAASPLGGKAIVGLWRHYDEPEALVPYQGMIIKHQALAGLLMIVGLTVDKFL